MFDKAKIQASLSGLVGYRNPTNPDYAIVSSQNQISRSGRYINDNPFCKVEYLKDNSDYKDQNSTQFNTELSNLVNTAISNLCDQVFNDNDYIDRQLVYQNPNNKVSTETNLAGFKGFEIEAKKDTAFILTRVFCEFENTGTFTLCLFNSNKPEAVQSKEITITSKYQEVSLNWACDNTNVYGGEWYVGYFNETLNPYKRNYESANIRSEYKEICVKSIFVPNVSAFFDLQMVQDTNNCHGLNFDVTVYRDYTDLIIQNQNLFAYGLQLQCQINVIELCRASLRGNLNQRISQEMLIEVEGIDSESGIKKEGLKSLMLNQIKSLKAEINRLKTNYMPFALDQKTLS